MSSWWFCLHSGTSLRATVAYRKDPHNYNDTISWFWTLYFDILALMFWLLPCWFSGAREK